MIVGGKDACLKSSNGVVAVVAGGAVVVAVAAVNADPTNFGMQTISLLAST